MILQDYLTDRGILAPEDFPVNWLRVKAVVSGCLRSDIWEHRYERRRLKAIVVATEPLYWVKEYTPTGETLYEFYSATEAHAFYVSHIDTCPLCDYEEGAQ